MSGWKRFAPSHANPWRPWLAAPGSLTARLRAHGAGFRVQVIAQGLRRPYADEWRELGGGAPSFVLVREVLLHLDGRPVVLAHSIAKACDLHGTWRALAGLGSRPLAEALFSDPLVCREPLSFARLDARHPLHRRATEVLGALQPNLWARRSRFRRAGRPLLVTEAFLPALLSPR